ncbi:dihydroneopterin aldolase / 2-amino-4-hydroxy-6-hydroxymethyldihydropteridine diphosphokinase [Peptoniphilus asaccharolyticus DSM 20463]|uniref:Bifunctional folate synthesis protein n=1 Tax=Peptoniphilus asaccharolyticus DSM 20463 TaxID=573058 RepID=A0A1W1UMB3_PEPAS|nr:2-amino-4-hydroxy-6-hydroxymethyldihydropteridine diphosphokinase [Peptoniphilus asaccharolyticus]MBL7574872.1 2-amino-4-hydroxy-6-hydroxymethyldihydropteridine diphosphokinase [Peptoniphilus asaccharolyticus]SMB81941.1 dihydroneopterin aldolase / 2-amino-4-hydroxy-6-hydroxymethyldihydropteridine diphosphokinase [Peptoniphilus asaccharolyticus DSM 20463]
MDYIKVSNLIVFANHGVFKEEKTLGQKFVIDINLGLQTQEAALTNDLEKSVHYGFLSQEIQDLFQSKSNDLIETCAEEIAQFILYKYSLVDEVSITVKKPWAPVHLPLDEVLVQITRKRFRCFLGLGSNLGDSLELLNMAYAKIEDNYTKIIKKSSVYTTPAWGLENQPDFKNSVIEIETTYSPQVLLKHLQKIEIDLGRERKIHWGPRTIDIDILFVEDQKIYQDNLIVPHPYIQEREFVLEPLCEIAPHFIHPVLNKSIRNIYDEFKSTVK